MSNFITAQQYVIYNYCKYWKRRIPV